MDHGGVALSDLRRFSRRALGLLGPGLGRLLGMGPGGERFYSSLAQRNGFSAFRDDAGKTRHDEGVERLSHLYHLYAFDSGHIAGTQRPSQFRPFVRAIHHRHMVCRVYGMVGYAVPITSLLLSGLS